MCASRSETGCGRWVSCSEYYDGDLADMAQLSIPSSVVTEASPAITASSAVDLGEMSPTEAQPPPSDTSPVRPTTRALPDAAATPFSVPSSPSPSRRSLKGKEKASLVQERTDELCGVLVGFAFALQHHLHGSRPLPQPPLCDLLPPAYLLSLKRTEARVRFAEAHAGPSSPRADPASLMALSSAPPGAASDGQSAFSSATEARPGLRRRSTGPPTEAEKTAAAGSEEWELAVLRSRAEEAVQRFSDAIHLSGGGGGADEDVELRQQLSQLNLPTKNEDESDFAQPTRLQSLGLAPVKPKSSLYSPHPGNLPLALLRLMEVYAEGLAAVPPEQGGWAEAKRERVLGVVKSLSASLGEAEKLVASEWSSASSFLRACRQAR